MSQMATYKDKRQVVARAYPPGGCLVHVGRQKCGETKGLDIIMDFHKLYQEKMSQIDVSAGGDSLQEKVDLQEEWINDLTEQNQMLAKVIEELEMEAIGRVQQLEDKLKNAAKSFGEDDQALADRDKKIRELEEALKALPATTEKLKKKSDENDRLKQPEPSEKEIKNHPMSQEPSKVTASITTPPAPVETIDQSSLPAKDLSEPKDSPPTQDQSMSSKGRVEPADSPTEDQLILPSKVGPEDSYFRPDDQSIVSSKGDTQTKDSHPSYAGTLEPTEESKGQVPSPGGIADTTKESKGEVPYPVGISEPTEESKPPCICSPKTSFMPFSTSHEPSDRFSTNDGFTPKESARSEKSVHLLIEDTSDKFLIVEPEKDHNVPPGYPEKPKLESVPVIGTNDSLELQIGCPKSTDTEPPQLQNPCLCTTENFWEEFEKLRDENKILREGSEIQRLKSEIDEKMKRILELNEENRALNNMINMLKSNQIKTYGGKDNNMALITKYSEEIDDLKKALNWSKKEKEEYELLKQRIKLLEQGKGDTENITSNLQTAVDLYVNTIKLLEASEEKLRMEVEQYKVNNEAMQGTLVSLRQEMEEMKQQFIEDIRDQIWQNFTLYIDNVDIEHNHKIYKQQIQTNQKLYQQLMELNYDLEVEHVNTLQDLSMLESQFHKYQSLSRLQEEEKTGMKTQLKKLSKKNKCYEEVVQFFKEEMSVMSDELLTLQEVLNATNVCSQEENNKLINAILQLRRINDRLVGHLCAIEKQVVLENQINQINEARINELQHIIGTKNNDLTQHDEIIQDMRKKLSNATKQNADMKKTIKNLTDTVVEIQDGIKSVEREQHRNKDDVSAVESKVCLANGDLEDIKVCMEQKNNTIMDLENQLKSQEVALILATKELEMLKEKKVDNKELINTLKEQLTVTERKNRQIIGDYQVVAKQLQDYTSLDHMKNYELNHYKNIVDEMRMSLMQLNNGLEKCEATNIHFYEDLRHSDRLPGMIQPKKSNLSVVFGELKKSMADMKRRLNEADFKGGLIEEELLKVKESHMSQIQEEVSDTQKELETKIMSSIEEQARLTQVIEDQREEIEKLKEELENEKKETCCCKRSVSELKNEKMTSNAQMEIAQVKSELNKSLQRQKLLDEENDKMHTQMINLRKKLTMMEHVYEVQKQEQEECKMQLKKTLREKEYVGHKNHELVKTIEQMRSTHDQLEKQCRYSSDCVRNLELELSEAQAERDDISGEAQNLVRVVKMWLQEQNTVNGQVRGKFRNYADKIDSLKQTMMKRMSEERSWVKTPMQQPFSQRRYGTAPYSDRRASSPTSKARKSERPTTDSRYRPSSPWRCLSAYLDEDFLAEDTHSHRSNLMRNISYDSNSSPYSSRSPSPRSNSLQGEDEMDDMNLNDWFSPNYKETDTDADEGEDDSFVNKVQMMTAQVQEANKRWQQKMNREHLSKSRASNK